MQRFVTLLIALMLSSLTDATDLQPFYAEYRGEYQGLPVNAKGIRQLTQRDDGSYELTSSASALFMNLEESTEFELINGQVVPRAYHYERKMLGKKKQEAVIFDWGSMTASHEGTTSPLTNGTLDKLGYQLQLRLDVAQHLGTPDNQQTLSYLIADEEKRKDYTFSFIGEETLSTPAGELKTIVVTRYRADKDRRTTVWLAIDHHLLLVRLKQEEPDKGFELNLERFEFPHEVAGDK
ncbi:MAG: DUF3108 domain-containing protein [Pseudomonadales bacterium]|nr:DUF3108 domain-containing protein [Pseudomonadales bacterium]MBO6596063.1 DUF3108 domain-containing protein [Pseudomonadales bacterium]MBO6702683.1 DUF3108 domain-containing protein [Pseudomonadales bacterium]MBO6822546.1 DUF3108 domain-containing protein [Pseudomonadales bacterium]MBO7004703.1 DUF3108 domain-containing protein [Pseudomonadales bacterium]